jgi:antirestriction protein ArdC
VTVLPFRPAFLPFVNDEPAKEKIMTTSCEKPWNRLRSPKSKKRSRVTKRRFNDSAEERQDVYTRVTNVIAAQLEKGVRPWAQPWEGGKTGTRPLRHNGVPYSGVNVLMLWASAMERGYETPYWMTYNQSVEYGAHVRKGEKGSLVVYANAVIKKEHDDKTGEDLERSIPFLKGYTVFNADQIEGLPEHYYAKPPPKRGPMQRLAHADAFIAATGATILYGGGRAYYSPDADAIRMPKPEVFESPEAFYATELHELTHWTKSPGRLNRDFGRKAWGDEGYAQEELVAELASAFLCADLEITPDIREDHAAYIGNWLTALKNDARYLFQAASHAQRAVDFLHKLQPEPEVVAEPAPSENEL